VTKNSHKLPAVMWGGFINDRLDLDHYVNDSGSVYGVLYRTRKEASERYDDVRRVSLMQCPPKRRRRG